MKKNAKNAIPFIQKALSEVGDDFSLQSARSYLISAMRIIEQAQAKRINRDIRDKNFAEIAKDNHTKWWNQIKENAKKMALEQLSKDLELKEED